jgi:hypothetical protein
MIEAGTPSTGKCAFRSVLAPPGVVMVALPTLLRNQSEREAKGRARGRRKARGQGQYKGRDTPKDTPALVVLVAACLIGVGKSEGPEPCWLVTPTL